jgi:hypothetical protein
LVTPANTIIAAFDRDESDRKFYNVATFGGMTFFSKILMENERCEYQEDDFK